MSEPDDTPTRLAIDNLRDLIDNGVVVECPELEGIITSAEIEYAELRAEVSRLREALQQSVNGADLDHQRAQAAEAEVSRLQQEHAKLKEAAASGRHSWEQDGPWWRCVSCKEAWAGYDIPPDAPCSVSKLLQEQARLTHQLEQAHRKWSREIAQKDAEIVELKDAVYRLCPPRS